MSEPTDSPTPASPAESPRDGSVWEDGVIRVEVVHSAWDGVRYRVIRDGSHRRMTTMETAKFVARFREVPHAR